MSALGFGCSSVWAMPAFPIEDARAIFDGLLAEGVNHFDTSPSYGHGEGEKRLGAFLKSTVGKELVIATKVGSNLVDGKIVRGFSRQAIQRSFEESLARLGVGHVDILYLHGPAISDLSADVLDFFDTLKVRGAITYSGVNSFDNAVLDHVATLPIDAVMLQYNVGDFRNAEAMQRLHDAGKIVFSGTSLARAKFDLSTFLPRDRASVWYLLRMLRHDPGFLWSGVRLARRLKQVGGDPTDIALRFVTANPLLTSSLFGTSRLDHALANARGGRGSLSEKQRLSLVSSL